MFHKNVPTSARSISTVLPFPSNYTSQSNPVSSARLILVPSGSGGAPKNETSSRLADFIAVSSRHCAAFFAEAAVLVLVLTLLDRFMAKGRLEPSWIVSAMAISFVLLAASIATEFTARRWLKAH